MYILVSIFEHCVEKVYIKLCPKQGQIRKKERIMKGAKYPPKVKAQCKADYQSGNYSLRDVEEKRGICLKTLFTWKREGNWEKGIDQAEIERMTVEAANKMFAKEGLPKRKAIQKIVELVKSGRKDHVKDGIKLWLQVTGSAASTNVNHSGRVVTGEAKSEEELLLELEQLEEDDKD